MHNDSSGATNGGNIRLDVAYLVALATSGREDCINDNCRSLVSVWINDIPYQSRVCHLMPSIPFHPSSLPCYGGGRRASTVPVPSRTTPFRFMGSHPVFHAGHLSGWILLSFDKQRPSRLTDVGFVLFYSYARPPERLRDMYGCERSGKRI